MCDSVVPLLANISVACSDEKRLFEALKNALSWNFNSNDDVNPLKTVQLVSSKQAIVWIRGTSLADSMVSNGTFPISGPLSAVFQHPGNALSSLVEVSLKSKSRSPIDSNKMDNIVETLKKKFRAEVDFFRSNLRCVCLFTSPSMAELGLRLVQQIAADQDKQNPSSFVVRQIPFKDQKILACSFEGSSPFSSQFGDLRSRSVVELIREKLDFLTEKPLILSVQSMSQDSPSSVEPIYIVCATYYDLRLLSNCPAVAVGSGRLVFRDVSEKQRTDTAAAAVLKEETRPKHGLYLFW